MPRLWAMNRYWHQPPARSRTATPSWTDRVIRVAGARSTKPPHALFDKFMQDNRLRQNPSGRPEKVATVSIRRDCGYPRLRSAACHQRVGQMERIGTLIPILRPKRSLQGDDALAATRSARSLGRSNCSISL